MVIFELCQLLIYQLFFRDSCVIGNKIYEKYRKYLYGWNCVNWWK